MPLVGAGAVTMAALVLGIRSKRGVNKALTVVLWGGYMALSTGGVL